MVPQANILQRNRIQTSIYRHDYHLCANIYAPALDNMPVDYVTKVKLLGYTVQDYQTCQGIAVCGVLPFPLLCRLLLLSSSNALSDNSFL